MIVRIIQGAADQRSYPERLKVGAGYELDVHWF
jgi:hypothetical protein